MALIPCPGCGRIISDTAPSCIQCGRPTGAPTTAGPAPAPQAGGAVPTLPQAVPSTAPRSGHRERVVEPVERHTFFPVTLSKFVVMSIVSFNLYAVYWAYRNWERINTRSNDNDSVSPFWRAFFAPIWGFSLFTRVRDTAERRVNVWWAPGVLGGLYLVLSVISRLPDPWWLVSMLAFVPLLPVVRTIQQLHAAEPASEGQNGRYSGANIAGIIIGGIIVILAVWGTLYPPPEGV